MASGNATTPSPLPLSNCSELVVNSHPVELVEDTGGYIIIIYVYAVFVVAATLVLYARYVGECVLEYVMRSRCTMPTYLFCSHKMACQFHLQLIVA